MSFAFWIFFYLNLVNLMVAIARYRNGSGGSFVLIFVGGVFFFQVLVAATTMRGGAGQ